MRLESFEIKNYKGVANAQLDGLASESVLTISGRNGTGKSLILEALVGAWTQRYQMPQRVGPWGNELVIRMGVHLADDEWAAVDAWYQKANGAPIPRSGTSDELTFEVFSTISGGGFRHDSPVMSTLRNQQFQRENRFAVIDFLAANRLVPNAGNTSVDLAMLGVERVEQDRFSMLDQAIQSRAPMSLPSVSSYLVTLDYQSFLAQRQGLAVSNDYEMLARSFQSATDKTLREPEYDPAKGSNIEVQLPTGHTHGLADLSSGEQEMLAMMYFVRRLSASGGILFIDEPEQHLHPTLQAALFDSMRGLAERAQVVVVSHSVNLISAAPLSGLVQVAAPSDELTNQVQRLTDHPDKVDLIGTLGLGAGDLFQSDVLVVVEGDTDAQWLRSLFPVELGRAHVLVAGSARQVLDTHDVLERFSGGLPWLCVRDRDLLSGAEVEAMQERYPRLHVWPRRAIESCFLDPALITATMNGTGQDLTVEEVRDWLAEKAAALREEVLAQLVEQELSRLIPPPAVPSTGDRYEKMAGHLRSYAAVNVARAEAVESVVAQQRDALEARWPADWPVLVDPKPLIAQLAGMRPVFKNAPAMMSALVARAREDEGVRPASLEELRVKRLIAIEGVVRAGG